MAGIDGRVKWRRVLGSLLNGSLQRLIKPAPAVRENSALTALENLAHENPASENPLISPTGQGSLFCEQTQRRYAEHVIEFESVGKTYPGGAVAVESFTYTVPKHRTVVLVGSSGSGKTTLLRMVNRMVDPTSGRVLIDGVDVREADPVKLRRSIGYVLQDGGLLPHRTVADNVATVPILNGTPRREARSAALELLERVGLDPELGARYPAQLSGGQAQRVGVARALAADASILLMDEPFSAVDPIVRTELQEELLRLQGELHKTIVFVTHDIDEALFLGDNIAVFAPGGKLAQYGAPEEILTNPANDFVESFVSQSVGALLPADVMRQVRYIRRERYRRTGEAAVSGEGAASTSGRG